MLFGVHQFPTEYSIQPHELARATEERGLESIWLSEHTHIPVSYIKTREENGTPLRDFFWKLYDPFVALSYIAATTEKIKIGTGVNLIVEHDPIELAKKSLHWIIYLADVFCLALERVGSKAKWLITVSRIEHDSACLRKKFGR